MPSGAQNGSVDSVSGKMPKHKGQPDRLPTASPRSSASKDMAPQTSLPTVAEHGALRLRSVDVDSYNVELRDDEGFIGDRANKGAFRNI
jgi:hypothetical protein